MLRRGKATKEVKIIIKDMQHTIFTAINSEEFKTRLTRINDNYSNLKQENHIRNLILEILNSTYLEEGCRAFAEHPRELSRRVDLSIVQENNDRPPYTIELKFQYTNDYKQFLDYDRFIENDFERTFNSQKCDMFILIISHWDKKHKQAFEDRWGIHPKYTLSKYLSPNENWKVNVATLFNKYKNQDVSLTEVSITVDKPYTTHYHFYVMTRNVGSRISTLLQAK